MRHSAKFGELKKNYLLYNAEGVKFVLNLSGVVRSSASYPVTTCIYSMCAAQRRESHRFNWNP